MPHQHHVGIQDGPHSQSVHQAKSSFTNKKQNLLKNLLENTLYLYFLYKNILIYIPAVHNVRFMMTG